MVGVGVGVTATEMLLRTRKIWTGIVAGPLIGWLLATALAAWVLRGQPDGSDAIIFRGVFYGVPLGVGVTLVMAIVAAVGRPRPGRDPAPEKEP